MEGGKMTVLIHETYVVRPENQEKFMQLWKRFLEYMKENPETFKEVKSVKLYTQMFGGISGAYVELLEFDSLADHEKLHDRIFKDKEFMKLYQEIMPLFETGMSTTSAWKPVP